jgi:predicted outer membrane repeat protein
MVKSFHFVFILVTIGGAKAAEHYASASEPPVCEVDASGYTHVFYHSTQHPSFKCTHTDATTCTCVTHPTHNTGGCKQFESKLAGKHVEGGGDCTDSGKDPTFWTGADLAAHVQHTTSTEPIHLASGTFAWSSEVSCTTSRTITLNGAGKGVTILDANKAHRFFTLSNGCSLILNDLTMINGEGGVAGGGAIMMPGTANLDATDVEFKDNKATMGSGGALFAEVGTTHPAHTTCTRCDFTRNTCYYYGGAIFSHHDGSFWTFNDPSFVDNASTFDGGAIYYQYYTPSGNEMVFSGSKTFTGNTAGRHGATCRNGGASHTAVASCPSS